MVFKQDLRMGRLSTTLGKDVLVLQRFEGVDRVNGLFDYHVACLSANANVDFDSLLGTHATVTLVGQDGTEHFFDGLVTESRWIGSGENGHRYELVMKPWFWLATMKRNQRIFHEKSVIEILQELLSFYGSAGSLVVKTNETYDPLEYTVQYRESDFDFACRMMERHGISYHFEPKNGAHDMVLTDATEPHELLGSFPVKPYVGHHQEDVEHLWEWRPERRMVTGGIRLTDYNFKKPTTVMEKNQESSSTYEHGKIESFDWPGHYLEPGEGAKVSQLRLRREQGQDKRYEALGDIVGLRSGMRMTVSGESEDVPGKGETFLCLVAHHSYTSDNYGSGGTSGDGFAYTGRYVFMPSNAPLAPETKTSYSDVRGPMTAVVVGNGEIDCDEFGRILVQFPWDLNGAKSMRCRVAQNWAGAGWGGMVIPRIGMEVLVEFINGDPDHPMVTGCVYNGKNEPAYPLPKHKTKSVFRTDTHQGTGFNEMVFEDEPGQEHITFKAQQDFSKLVLNDAISRVHGSDVESVGNNKLFEVGNNFKVDAGGSVNFTVGGTGPQAKNLLNGLSGLTGKTRTMLGQAGASGPWVGTVGSRELGFHSGSGRDGLRSPDETGSDANHQMRLDGTKYGKAGYDLFKTPGTMNLFAANFRSDTTGVASAEQVGKAKVLNVGEKLIESIGKEMKTSIGQKQETTVGQSILNQTMKHTLIATQKFTIAAPGGSIEIDMSGITIKAFTLKFLCPSVDFNPGAPSQAAVLSAQQAFAEQCQGTMGE